MLLLLQVLTEEAADGHSFVTWSKLHDKALILLRSSRPKGLSGASMLPVTGSDADSASAAPVPMPAWPEHTTPLLRSAAYLIVSPISRFCIATSKGTLAARSTGWLQTPQGY